MRYDIAIIGSGPAGQGQTAVSSAISHLDKQKIKKSVLVDTY
ncbi:hypothetical protein [Clostridioides sp. ZZV15-6388]